MSRAPAVALAILLAGCAGSASSPDPAPAPLVLAPPMALAAVPAAVPLALKRDSAAVQRHARQFVAKPSTPPEAVTRLEPLTQRVNRALAVMDLHRRREGRYRPADVRAARAAADAVAHFLDQQDAAVPAQTAKSQSDLRDVPVSPAQPPALERP